MLSDLPLSVWKNKGQFTFDVSKLQMVIITTIFFKSLLILYSYNKTSLKLLYQAISKYQQKNNNFIIYYIIFLQFNGLQFFLYLHLYTLIYSQNHSILCLYILFYLFLYRPLPPVQPALKLPQHANQ